MKKIIFPTILTFSLIPLTGCISHLSQQQCATLNWQSEGFNDAASGQMPRNLNQAIKDCAKYNIPVPIYNYQTGWVQGAHQYCTPAENVGYAEGVAGRPALEIYHRTPICNQAGIKLKLNAYEIGRQKGLKVFCTYENGIAQARQGQPLADVCPATLRKQFATGWSLGKEEFCNQLDNAFALGRENKPYPVICSPNTYYAFKAEYDRGSVLYQRIAQLQSRVDALEREIFWQANKYSLRKTEFGRYELGDNKSPEAREAWREVNFLLREKRHKEAELFDLKLTR